MGSKYISQKIEIVKMKIRFGKSSQLLRRIAFLVFFCLNITLTHWRKYQESVFWENKLQYLQQNFKIPNVEFSEKKK